MGKILDIRVPIADPNCAPEIFADEINLLERIGDVGRFVFTIAGCTAEEGVPHFRQVQLKLLFPLIKVPNAVNFVRTELSGVRIGNDPPLFPGTPPH